jgi:hypothetical protein
MDLRHHASMMNLAHHGLEREQWWHGNVRLFFSHSNLCADVIPKNAKHHLRLSVHLEVLLRFSSQGRDVAVEVMLMSRQRENVTVESDNE